MDIAEQERLTLVAVLNAMDTCLAALQRIYDEMTATLKEIDRCEQRWHDEVEAEAERLSAVEAMN